MTTHHGAAPPWEGSSPDYGSWEPDEPLWDGTPTWRWVPPSPRLGAIGLLSQALKDMYLPGMRRAMSTRIKWLEETP